MVTQEEYKNLINCINKQKAKLVVVSKNRTIEEILSVYKYGQRDFGENRVQELKLKVPLLPKDIKWHMIGHLQRNKVKHIAPFISLIQSVDSLKLLEEINKRAKENNRIINCLFQIHVAQEETKHGFIKKELIELLDFNILNKLPNVNIGGLMGIASLTDDKEQVRQEFRSLLTIFKKIKTNFCPNNQDFNILSMGMSSDYQVALEEGANMVRIGRKIFD